MNNIEIEYVFNDNVDITLNNILISILNTKIKVVDFDNET